MKLDPVTGRSSANSEWQIWHTGFVNQTYRETYDANRDTHNPVPSQTFADWQG
jgi:hypothetical protein